MSKQVFDVSSEGREMPAEYRTITDALHRAWLDTPEYEAANAAYEAAHTAMWLAYRSAREAWIAEQRKCMGA
jgi:hypothetical protein